MGAAKVGSSRTWTWVGEAHTGLSRKTFASHTLVRFSIIASTELGEGFRSRWICTVQSTVQSTVRVTVRRCCTLLPQVFVGKSAWISVEVGCYKSCCISCGTTLYLITESNLSAWIRCILSMTWFLAAVCSRTKQLKILIMYVRSCKY